MGREKVKKMFNKCKTCGDAVISNISDKYCSLHCIQLDGANIKCRFINCFNDADSGAKAPYDNICMSCLIVYCNERDLNIHDLIGGMIK